MNCYKITEGDRSTTFFARITKAKWAIFLLICALDSDNGQTNSLSEMKEERWYISKIYILQREKA